MELVLLLTPWHAVRSCPPFASLGLLAGKALLSPVAIDAQTSVLVSCPAGFRFDSDTGPGTVEATCQSDCEYGRGANESRGRPFREAFRCQPSACLYVREPNAQAEVRGSGALVADNLTLQTGDIVDVTCSVGYRSRDYHHQNSSCAPLNAPEKSSTYSVLCKEGVLNDTAARCVPVVCPKFESSDKNLRASSTSALYGGAINLTCRYGYQFNTSSGPSYYTAVCLDTCSYNVSAPNFQLPTCIRKSCVRPKHSHGSAFTSIHNGALSYVTAWTSVHNASLSYATAWTPTRNASKGTCSAANCSCSQGVGGGQASQASPQDVDCQCGCVEVARSYCSAANCSCSTTQTASGMTAVAVTTSAIGQSCGCGCEEAGRAVCSEANCSCVLAGSGSHVVARTVSHWNYSCGCTCEEVPFLPSRSYLARQNRLVFGQTLHLECDFGYVLVPRQAIVYQEQSAQEPLCSASTCSNCTNLTANVSNCTNMTALQAGYELARAAAQSANKVARDSAIADLVRSSCRRSAFVMCDDPGLSPAFMCLPRFNNTPYGEGKSGCATQPCPYPLSIHDIGTQLGEGANAFSKLASTSGYGVNGYWAHGTAFESHPEYANHLSNITVACGVGHKVVPLHRNGSTWRESVTCAPDVGSTYQATCTHGRFQGGHTCVPMKCPTFDSSMWAPHTAAVEPLAPVDYGESINITCNIGYRPALESPADVEAPRWQAAACQATCGYDPMPCTVVACDQVLPPNAHVIAGPYPQPLYNASSGELRTPVIFEDSLSLDCDFGYTMTTSSSASSSPYVPGALRVYENPKCSDVPGWRDQVTPWLGCGKYLARPQLCGSTEDKLSRDSVHGMNASEACCVCGGGVRPANCETRLDVACADGRTIPEASCLPSMECGCGSAPCTIRNASVFGKMVVGYSVGAIPGYGQDGFWARGPFFDGNSQRINHRVPVLARCAPGHRVASLQTAFVTNCNADRAFSAVCNDCFWDYGSQACKPVACAAYQGPVVAYVASQGPLPSGDYVASATAPSNQQASLFGEAITVTCKDKARAMPLELLPDDACAAPQTFNATCNDACGWNASHACQVLLHPNPCS